MASTAKPRGQSVGAKILITIVIGVLLLFVMIPALQGVGRRLLTASEPVLIHDETVSGGRELELATLLPPDRIPAILIPRSVPAFEASLFMEADEQVLGLSIDGDARAYAVKMLSRHYIVNDIGGGKPVAVTW